MVKIKWTKKLKEKYGYSDAKDVDVADERCLKKDCFRVHDWNHDGHLLCWTREQGNCLGNKKEVRNSSQA